MEFHEKLQQLRTQKQLTQEQLAEQLYVSRTAVSKWESGRGYPSIDSLKIIAEFFSVTIDELLSGKELIRLAEKDSAAKTQHLRDLIFGLLDCAMALVLVIPLLGQREGTFIRQVSLLSFAEAPAYLKTAYFAVVLLTVLFGIATLALQNSSCAVWQKSKSGASMLLSILGVILFMISLQAYAAFFTFTILLIKGVLLLKRV